MSLVKFTRHIDTEISEFGINNAYVEVNILLTVNVQIIVPLATKKSVVKQKIPVAMGLIQGTVPQIYTTGGGDPPSVEVPPLPERGITRDLKMLWITDRLVED